MTDEQLERLVLAVEGLTQAFEKVARPTVIVTKDENCELVWYYRKHGYPVYYPDGPSGPVVDDKLAGDLRKALERTET